MQPAFKLSIDRGFSDLEGEQIQPLFSFSAENLIIPELIQEDIPWHYPDSIICCHESYSAGYIAAKASPNLPPI